MGRGTLSGTVLWKGFQEVLWPGSGTEPTPGAPTSALQADPSLQQEHIVFRPCSPTQATLNADPAANSYVQQGQTIARETWEKRAKWRHCCIWLGGRLGDLWGGRGLEPWSALTKQSYQKNNSYYYYYKVI